MHAPMKSTFRLRSIRRLFQAVFARQENDFVGTAPANSFPDRHQHLLSTDLGAHHIDTLQVQTRYRDAVKRAPLQLAYRGL